MLGTIHWDDFQTQVVATFVGGIAVVLACFVGNRAREAAKKRLIGKLPHSNWLKRPIFWVNEVIFAPVSIMYQAHTLAHSHYSPAFGFFIWIGICYVIYSRYDMVLLFMAGMVYESFNLAVNLPFVPEKDRKPVTPEMIAISRKLTEPIERQKKWARYYFATTSAYAAIGLFWFLVK